MKKNSFSLQRSAVLLTAVLLAISAGACSAEPTPSGQGTGAGESAGAQSESQEQQNTASAGGITDSENESESNSDTNVTNSTSVAQETSSKITVSFQETLDEIKADDGTVILRNDVQMPVVSIDGAEDIAEKINADISAYYESFSIDETLSMAKEDYAASLGEDGWEFRGYDAAVTAKVTRMDDAVISFELVSSSYTGGAHGNYGSIGRNYDAKTGELISFDEISEDYEAFHATVLDYMVNLAETPSYKDKLFDNPSKADLDSALFRPESWVFTLSGISFMIDPYILGPYAAGEIYFMLPYEKAYDLGLKEDYRYNGNFVEERYYTSVYAPGTTEIQIDGKPEYHYDLNGDGTEEGIAFYGYTYDSEEDPSKMAFYIDGTDWGSIVREQIPTLGYLEQTYALYDRDPSDSTMEIAVLYTELIDEPGIEDRISHPYTYLFRYTSNKNLEFVERLEGYITRPAQP